MPWFACDGHINDLLTICLSDFSDRQDWLANGHNQVLYSYEHAWGYKVEIAILPACFQQQETLSEDTIKLKKQEEKMAEFKTRSLHEVQLLRAKLEDKQGEFTQVMKQVEQREAKVCKSLVWYFGVRIFCSLMIVFCFGG